MMTQKTPICSDTNQFPGAPEKSRRITLDNPNSERYTAVADNHPGSRSAIGTAVVVKAPRDGYTLLFNSSAHTVNPSLYASLPFDTLRDLVDIAPIAAAPDVLIVSPASIIRPAAECADSRRRGTSRV